MMDWTDSPYRRMARGLTRRTLLYTEMVTTGALLHGDAERHLRHHPEERPLALQLGGDDPDALATCAAMAEEAGFDEVNLNVGCPSDRVQRGRFGACLMAWPDVVAEAVSAMRGSTSLPVTVKHRIGIDDADRYEDMLHFVDVVASAGADRFVVHARKAWLSGLSPKQNRTVPPLRHHEVARLASERPALTIETNGGVQDVAEALGHLTSVAGVMIGRAAYRTPEILADADPWVFGEAFGGERAAPTVRSVAARSMEAIEADARAGRRTVPHVKPLIALVRDVPGARAWRRILSLPSDRGIVGPERVAQALAALPDEVADRPLGTTRATVPHGPVAARDSGSDHRRA